MFLVGCKTLKEKIAGLFIPQVLLNMYSNHLPQFDREDLDLKKCMIFCHALVPLLCPFVCSHLNISPFECDTASVEQAALSFLYVPFMCCFARFVC